MKKTFKRVMALVLTIAFMLAGAQSASAYNTYDTDINYEFDEVYLVDLNKLCSIDYPELDKDTVSVEIYPHSNVVKVIENKLYGEYCGATIIDFDQYDKNGDYIGTIYAIAVVVDEYDRDNESYLVQAYSSEITVNYKEYFCFEANIAYEGEDCLWAYPIVFDGYMGDSAYVYEDGYGDAFARGTDTFYGVIVDTNGNYEYVDFTVNVKYSFGQWLIKIFLFGWIWY